MKRIFDLDAGHVALGPVIAHDHVARLTDVDARIGSANRHTFFEQHVHGLHRVDAIGAVVLIRTIGPFDTNAADDDVASAVDLESIARSILDRQVLDREIARIHEQAFGSLYLPLE